MGRAPCCDKANVKRGPWSPEEDATLKSYLQTHGTAGNWIALPRKAGLRRCGKSCRLRWLNYLRPDIKHGGFTEDEDHTICNLYNQLGSRWSVIASHLPGRTDNDVKNYWNTKLKKKLLAGKISLATNNTTNFATQLITPTDRNTTSSNNNYAITQPSNNSCVPKLLDPDAPSFQNPATLTMLTDINHYHGLVHDQRLSFQYDRKDSLFMNLSSDDQQFDNVILKSSHIFNREPIKLSRDDQAGSDDSTSLLAVNDIKPGNGSEEFGGTTLMDFGFGLPYDDIMNDVSFDQEKAHNIISHDNHQEVVAPSYCISSYFC